MIDPQEYCVSRENGPWPLAFTINLTRQLVSFNTSPGVSWPGLQGSLCPLSPFYLLVSPAWPLSKSNTPVRHWPQTPCVAVVTLLSINLPNMIELSDGLAVNFII